MYCEKCGTAMQTLEGDVDCGWICPGCGHKANEGGEEKSAFEQGREDARKKLRDKFAMAALTGMIASAEEGLAWPKGSDAAEVAYKYADAMLAEREKGR